MSRSGYFCFNFLSSGMYHPNSFYFYFLIGYLWVVVDRFGSFWLVPRFSNYGSGRCFLRNFLSLLRRITANIKYIAARPALRFLATILKPFRAQRKLTASSPSTV